MARLEYWLVDSLGRETLLYYYKDMRRSEISARQVCDYFVKERKVYEKISTYTDGHTFFIYVRPSLEETPGESLPVYSARRTVYLEIREYKEWSNQYPLLQVYPLEETDKVVPILQSDLFRFSGSLWEKTSAETDEDRGTYVYYAIPYRGEGQHEQQN